MSQPPLQTGVDDVHAHPRQAGHRRADMAIAISVISPFVATGRGRIQEKLVAARS